MISQSHKKQLKSLFHAHKQKHKFFFRLKSLIANPPTTEAPNNPHFPETPFVTDYTTLLLFPTGVFQPYPFSCDAKLDHSSVAYYSCLNHTLKRLPLQDRDRNYDGRPFCPELGAPPTFFPSNVTFLLLSLHGLLLQNNRKNLFW
ncbi:hypothetical protein NPIL_253531 [Nephila pilipes]|uniref:Uncharacterized protein n=1 Tax=Nephila pilipes TaxID=299642 RepID=A0A8X6NSF7_NEPPI|nr:hypothetical protein NPIL_253531 [Nephila pilipes]